MPATATGPLVNGGISFWVQDAGRPAPRDPLPGAVDADVAIVGGGLTGLWTAYYLKKARPGWKIVVIEREFAGFGASGRNGGWMSAEPAGQFRRYAASRGADAARALQTEMFGAVRESVEVARQEGFGESVAENGLIHVATSKPQLSRARAHLRAMRQQGWGDEDASELSADEVGSRVAVEGALGGYATPHCARVHPAKYTFGLAAAVERLGVTIYEQTRATAIEPYRVTTDRGTVTARIVVRALEGYTLSLPGLARKLLPMNSSMVVTTPLTPEQRDAVGWRGGELVGDMAHSFSYMQITADDRVAIGGRGVPYNFHSGFDRNGRTAEFAVDLIRARLAELFPALEGIELEQTWSGVLGVPRDWCAAVNYDPESGMASAGGYTGHGLSGTNLAARTLRDLILGEDTPLARLPWVGRTARNWEVEPLRWFGATALYAAYRYADRREYAADDGKTSVVATIADTISGR
ncbi:FAD-binding oxidoreductase [Microbacterium sp. SYP-A9085]|uniref:NAD(P)/FAD-dependent oxidoreductase n=1 Tax=Microbacterium sp. SYP-A9085 TaxID=2664454 RepID=UPI0015621FC1|nr:FAD-binding oxidoreductase [Microbacterium sp. SYP-A9085]